MRFWPQEMKYVWNLTTVMNTNEKCGSREQLFTKRKTQQAAVYLSL